MTTTAATPGELVGLQAPPGSGMVPRPGPDERPTVYADRVGEGYAVAKSDRHRKSHGLYLTPVVVADFMAGRLQASGDRLRMLDPAAGAGVLCCAAVEAIAARERVPELIELVAYEVDADLIASLRAVLSYLTEWCESRHGMRLNIRIEATDFVMAHAEALRRMGGLIPHGSSDQGFDVVISNPPYFKIGKTDPRAVAASTVVHGQPNIYALFMAVSAALLRAGGDFIFITPRSFTSGLYFRQFRTMFFDMIRPLHVHVFGSRREAFSRDEVLQENVILAGARCDRWCDDWSRADLAISSSRGVSDIAESSEYAVPMPAVLDVETADRVLRLPASDADRRVLALVDSWPCTLHRLGLEISTGPVVAFRATVFIDREGLVPRTHVPLLWMNHVRAMRVTWPLNRHKPEYITRRGAEALLVPNRNYVLMRRFTAKEETRRLTAAPYLAGDFAIPEVGLENHLNYIHRPGGTLSEDEAWGLTALYNSSLLDTYFRCVNGNTQVNATELRAMPLPAHGVVVALGRRIRRLHDPLDGLDEQVMSLVGGAWYMETSVGQR